MMVRSRSFVSLLLVFLLPSASASFDCKFDITTHHFDLTSLKGVHTTSKTDDTPPTITNTTIFIDLCQDIQWDKEKYPVDDRCEDGTQVCVIRYTERDEEKTVSQIIPVAGTYAGHSLDAKTTLLHPASSDEVDGIIIELHGKEYQDQRQSTIIELTCDKTVVIGEPHFRSFNEGILRLDWRTQYACPTSADDPPPNKDKDSDNDKPSTKHWGFLTWMIIMQFVYVMQANSSVFLVIAAYVIYSAFLNYSRYGAGTGWDLVPHSDTLREIPYLMKDFVSHVIATVKGGSSRGGYSAV